jgi:prepilin-type processing-associated H-X9-DG protein
MVEKATSALQGLNPLNAEYADRHGWWVTGNWGDTLVTAMYPPNAYRKVAASAMAAWSNSASSMHPGGLNVLMGDGSVRFVSDTVQSWPLKPLTGDPAGAYQSGQGAWVNLPPSGVWQALSTRASDEIVAGGDY